MAPEILDVTKFEDIGVAVILAVPLGVYNSNESDPDIEVKVT